MKQSSIIFKEVFESFDTLVHNNLFSTIFFLVDENTHEFCLPVFLSEFESNLPLEIIEIPVGEENKTPEIAQQVWTTMAELQANRNSLLVNLGGGMVTDLGGFVASTYKRGIQFVNFPTSLLGMVDAAVGGKNGLDVNGIKNLVGTYTLPRSTFIFPTFLNTLPKRELHSGLAEMLKHGLIYNRHHWKVLSGLEKFTSEVLAPYIEESVFIKAEITALDPYEKGLRKILNFGHTIGHAVESHYLKTDKPYLHGEAIAIGILVESMLSYENELITKEELEEIFYQLIRIFNCDPLPENSIPNLLDWMKHDKKNEGDLVNFSLLDGIGKCKINIYQNDDQISNGIRLYNKKLETFK